MVRWRMQFHRVLTFLALCALSALGCAPADEPTIAMRPGTDAAAFARGRALFSTTFTPQTGLGPTYNSTSCVACHPHEGGEGDYDHRTYADDGDPRFTVGQGEHLYPASKAYRVPPPVFGLGYLDDVSDDAVLSGCGVSAELGIAGVPSIARSTGHPLRFGRELGARNLRAFASGALFHEIGVVNDGAPADEKGSDATHPAEISVADVADLRTFVAGLEALPVEVPDAAGQAVFEAVGCAVCHRLDRRGTDLCLHEMGPVLADGEERHRWRTAPIMGIGQRARLMHDGRAGADVAEAVLFHGGEGDAVRGRFGALSAGEREALVAFVQAL